MKYIFTLLLLATATVQAQIPAGYYSSATGTGYTLKTQLHNIIKNDNPQAYSEIDGFFPSADKDLYYENNNTILDPYSENPNGADPYNYSAANDQDQCGNYSSEGDCYNAEHVIPQSVFSQQSPMRGDAHHLLPTDGRVNGFRSNYPFGIAGNLVSQSGITNPTMNGSKLGNGINTGVAAGYTGLVFEPIDAFKGDIARIYFYFVTRYQNVISNWSSYPMFDGTTTKSIADPFLNILLTWHINDPVSAKEIARNNSIYNYQSNRNPFVDHPEYVCQIWSTNCSLGTAENEITSIAMFPNPSNGTMYFESEYGINSIEVISITGAVISTTEFQVPVLSAQIDAIPSGLYFIRILSNGNVVIKKAIVQ